MRTMHPVMKRGGLYWDRALLPPAVFAGRMKLLRQAVAGAGHDAWLLYGDAQRYGAVAWASHFLPRTRGCALLVVPDHDPTLLASVGARDVPAAKTLTAVEDVRPFSRFADGAAALLRERGLESGRIGTAGFETRLGAIENDALRSTLPRARWEAIDDGLDELRAERDVASLDTIRRAAEVADDGLATAADLLRPGTTERRAEALLDRALRRGGAEDVRILVASGPRAGEGLRPADDRGLVPGDIVLLHVSVELQRHWAEAAQTYSIGPASDATRSLADIAGRAVGTMAAAAGVGAAGRAVARAARSVLASDELARSALDYGLGHAICLDPEERPLVADGEERPIAEHEALALHIVLQVGGRGAIAGATVAAGERGASPFGTKRSSVIECASL